MTDPPTPDPRTPPIRATPIHERELVSLRRRLLRQATLSVDLLEASLRALWTLDADAAREVRRGEQLVDVEEVAIEEECLRIMTLQHLFGPDFRLLTFCLKVNQDIERVADHAASIAKITIRLGKPGLAPAWPTALTELGERVPIVCHRLLRAVLEQDEATSRDLVPSDEVIDELDKRLFAETVELISRRPDHAEAGLLIYRVGRDLERVADLMCNIAEDVVYLTTGDIIRHEKRARPTG